MIKKISLTLLIACLLFGPSLAQNLSLSHLMLPGKILMDQDGDGLVEKIELAIIIPDEPTTEELVLASEIAARINLESLALNFDLVFRESEIREFSQLKNPVLIGSRLKLSKEILKEKNFFRPELKTNQGLVAIFSHQSQQGIICLGGSQASLLKTGRAFFLRWPYLWEIWGRQSGFTWGRLENDLETFFKKEKINCQRTIISGLLYTFPPDSEPTTGLNSLNFKSLGEITSMTVELNFSDAGNLEKARSSLSLLAEQRRRGQRTDILAYPACAGIEFLLKSGQKQEKLILKRPGSSKRLLTPAFKEIPGVPEKPKQFDLTEIFSSRGIYVDRNQDGISDGLDSAVIIPAEFSNRNLPLLTTRLMLETAGGTFPVIYLDSEVENKKTLVAPILIGQNIFTEELLKTGQIKLPSLAPSEGIIKLVSAAPGFSDSVVITSPTPEGLGAILKYFSQTFPYLSEFKKGQPEISWLKEDLGKFLAGSYGAAEAYFEIELRDQLKKLSHQKLEKLELMVSLPEENPDYQQDLERYLKANTTCSDIVVKVNSINQPVTCFEREEQLAWEGDEALALVEQALCKAVPNSELTISLGISESPTIRNDFKQKISSWLQKRGLTGKIEVLSAYKQGYFWLAEKVLPELQGKPVNKILIKFAESQDLPEERIKRFHTDPHRWLQELYPVDEILARELSLPLENIEFELKPASDPIYEIQVFDDHNKTLLQASLSPRITKRPFLQVFPDWGSVEITTGWCQVKQDHKTLIDVSIKTDLERFWDLYQEEILKPVYEFVLKKTNHEPVFSKQPYFKRLLIELWLSEPDYRLGLDEEIISSLESLHDEIYFDTLDFLRAITEITEEDLSLPADASRSSAPGNVLPLIHPSSEGQAPRAKFRLEDFQARKPTMTLAWKISGLPPASKTWEFQPIKPIDLQLEEIIHDASQNRLKTAGISVQLDKEADFHQLAAWLETFIDQRQRRINLNAFRYPGLNSLKVKIRFQEKSLEKIIMVFPLEKDSSEEPGEQPGMAVPTDRIIGPEDCLKISDNLGRYPVIRSYLAGKSFEGRSIPVLEIYLPVARYVSLPRLITFKPTLHLTARQHANEVSSTNYSLKFAELLAIDNNYQSFLNKFSVVIQPMENPDGAALALELWKHEPFHSLHAGRYSTLGVDIGSHVGLKEPLLPEAKVRSRLNHDWLPDLYLNLHGYPSHEWIQLFSGYSPYLFRDYWIPKGWFTYYRQLRLEIYQPYPKAAEDLKKMLIQEMSSDPEIRQSNEKFYTRYERWAKRWSPFIAPLEIYDGVNIFSSRQSSIENRLNWKSQMTLVEETPEVMDETANGPWLDFLCRQGLTYLRAHAKYLSQMSFDIEVIEEEVNNRIRVEFQRRRPGKIN